MVFNGTGQRPICTKPGSFQRYPTESVNIYTSHFFGSLPKKNLSSIAGLAFPYTPRLLLETFQRLCSKFVHPVLYYIHAGACSGPLQVIDSTSSTVTWYQVDHHSSLLKGFPRQPYLTMLDAQEEVYGTAAPLLGPLPSVLCIFYSFAPYCPPSPSQTAVDYDALGSTALQDFLRCYPKDAVKNSNQEQPGAADDF